MNWHLDVTFLEDFNTTIDKTAALNLNIMRKFYLSILRLIDVSKSKYRIVLADSDRVELLKICTLNNEGVETLITIYFEFLTNEFIEKIYLSYGSCKQ